MDPTNEERAERADTLLDAYIEVSGLESEGIESVVNDLLTDLMHLCHERGISFGYRVLMAETNFEAETSEED